MKMIIRKPIFISNIWGTYKHRCSQRFLCVGFILWLLHKTVATVIASFYRLFKYWVSIPRYASTRNNIQILHAYAFHHNSRNLFHINAMKQNHFLLNLRKLIFCLTVMLIYVIVYIFSFLLLFRMKEKLMKIIQCQMDCPIIKGTKNVSFEAHQILLQCFLQHIQPYKKLC